MNTRADAYRNRQRNLDNVVLCIVGIMYIAAIVCVMPFITNDGPVHIAFSSFLSHVNDSDWYLQNAAYEVNNVFVPNLGVYYLARLLLVFFSPSWSEGIIQIICLTGPAAAGYFAVSQINKDNRWWVIFLFPLALNKMFFLGLYNYSLSIVFCLLSIGLFLWMQKQRSWFRAALTACSLITVFLFHASGFLVAGLTIATIVSVNSIKALSQGAGIRHVTRKYRMDFCVLLAPVPLGIFYVLSQDNSYGVHFGIGIFERLVFIAELSILNVNIKYNALTAIVISGILLGGVLTAYSRFSSGSAGQVSSQRDGFWSMFAALVVTMTTALVFPDVLGGGWTHFWRMAVFPFFIATLCLGYLGVSGKARLVLLAAGFSVATVLIGSAVYRQLQIHQQLAPLQEINLLVGKHSTVLPIVAYPGLVDADKTPVAIGYNPFYQVASRLELTGDRVVLFSYLARLNIYPVKFREGVEPQKNIFQWRDRRRHTSIKKVDINNFERTSGMQVDYLLVWSDVEDRPQLAEQVSLILNNYALVYESDDKRVRLFKRLD